MADALTRRGLVAAAVVAATLPAIAAGSFGNADAELFALREPYERTFAAALALSPEHNRAEKAAIALLQAQPGRDREEIKREVGLDVAEAHWEAALDVNSEVIQQIVDTPARTIEGLIFKARICERESLHPDLAESIVADLVAMGGLDA